MSLELNIRFSDSRHFIVRYEDEETPNLEFHDPLLPGDREDIRWYLEVYGAHWTSDPDDARAAAIQKKLYIWGAALFDAVFKGDDKARNLFTFFLDEDDEDEAGRLLTVSANHPAVLSLPWELLHPPGGSFLAVDNPPISVRRRLMGVGAGRKPLKSTPKDALRLLFVVSRPSGASFIDPRLDPQAVLAALAEAGVTRVETEFLRPATLEALHNRLRDSDLPAVDILHFDGHGVYGPSGRFYDTVPQSLLDDIQIAVPSVATRGLVMATSDNQDDSPLSAQDRLGYLLFEDADGSNALISARALGELLYKQRISMVVLSACQSATLRGDEEDAMGSVSAWLTHAGIPNVLAMGYMVLVETTRRLFRRFYSALLDGKPVGVALDKARADLYFDPRRGERLRGEGGLDAMIIKLHDWFVPQLYQSGKDIPLLKTESSAVQSEKNVHHNLPPLQEAGFFGRARELWAIERTFVAGTRRLGITGFGGQGKTYLAVEAGDWLLRSGMFERVCFISYAGFQGVDPLGVALSTLATVLDERIIDADAATSALAQTPTLVILDNFESLDDRTASPLLDAAAAWSEAGDSRVLLTSRQPDFAHPAYPLSNSKLYRTLPLYGLGDEDALAYFRALWALPPLPTLDPPGRPEALKLFQRVDNHPLSIGLLAQQLKFRTAKKLNERLSEVLAAASSGDNRALLASLELSLEHLDEEARHWLPSLGVFEGGAMEDILLRVTGLGEVDEFIEGRNLLAALQSGEPTAIARSAGIELPDEIKTTDEMLGQLQRLSEDEDVQILSRILKNNPPSPLIAGTSENTWPQLKAALINAGLVMPENLPGIQDLAGLGSFLRFHPTLAPALWAKLNEAQRLELQARHCGAYYRLSGILYYQDTQNPHAARAVAQRELPNLLRAVHTALDEADEDAADFADNVNRFLNYFGLRRDHAALTEKAAGSAKPGTSAWFMARFNLGEQLFTAGRSREAQAVFEELLASLATGASYERCQTLERLGHCRRTLGRSDEAEGYYREALAIAVELEPSPRIKRQSGALYTDLADSLRDMGDYAGARAAYEAALAIATEQDDKRQIGVIMGQLGTLALRQNELPEASRRYQEALALFQQLGEPATEAVVWHQLGMVHQEARQWDAAEQAYREAARLDESRGYLKGAAESWSLLAKVSALAGKPAEAEQWYRKAIAGGKAAGDEIGISKRLSNLADLLQQHFPARLDEARALGEESLAIKQTLDPAATEIWTTFTVLAQIADKQGEVAAAAEYRRQAREARMVFRGTRHELKKHGQLIATVVATVTQPENRAELEQALEQMASHGWTHLVSTLRRVLDGERDEDVLLESMDDEDALIVMTVLQGIQDPDSLQDLLKTEFDLSVNDKDKFGKLMDAKYGHR